jgi:group I intron endonuclease
MIGIYKITNPTDKIYIGQSINIEKRWQYYKSQYHNKKDKQNKLFNSFKKYGVDAHIFEIIEECIVEQLNEREIYWGNVYECTKPNIGLNLRELGKQGQWTNEARDKLSKIQLGKPRHTAESKAKISAALKGTKYTQEQRQKCSDNSGMRKKINHTGGSKKGWFRSNESKNNISIAKLGKPNIKDLRHIYQLDSLGNIINEFKGPTEAQTKTGIRRDSIGNVLKNKQKNAGGFVWRYKDNQD